MSSNKFYNKPELKLLLSKVLDQAFISERDHKQKFSHFFNKLYIPDLQKSVKDINHVNILFFGGTDDVERVIIGTAPEYIEIMPDHFPIDTLTIKYSSLSKILSHRDILGAILGLGIDRGMVGDILLFDQVAYVFLKKDIATFVYNNLERVGSTKVQCTLGHVEDLYIPIEQYIKIHKKLDNLQVSTIIATAFAISKTTVNKLISTKNVMINWQVVKNIDISEGITITVRGYGRIIVSSIIKEKSFSVELKVFK